MLPDRPLLDRYIVSYSTQVDDMLYKDKAIVKQLIETNDIEQALVQFLSLVADLRALPLASFRVHSIELVVHAERVDNHGLPLEIGDE